MPKSTAQRALALVAVLLCGCSSAYYAAMEQVGRHKRDILASRVRAGQQDQREAEQQFLSAYERFKQAARFDGGDLEDVYETLEREYERSAARAEDVRERIASIEDVAGALFREWESELEQIHSPELRAGSRRSLEDTRRRYDALIRAMRRAEGRMEPVLSAFRDQVLFLKHNLNARAVASLERSVVGIQDDVDALIRDMQRSIREAEVFLAGMQG